MTDKLTLFKSLFRGRQDVFPKYWKNKAGRKGYSPECENKFKKGICTFSCDRCDNQKFIPLSDSILKNHFAGNHLIGVYPLLQDGTCLLIAADFDAHGVNVQNNPLEDAKKFIDFCDVQDIQAYIERSKSGKGFHVWIFFENPIPAWKARLVILTLLKEAQIIDEDTDQTSFDRLFPNQDALSGKNLGNLIALPFYGKALKEGNSTFPDKDFKPITTDNEIIIFMEKIKRVPETSLNRIIKQWNLTREEPKRKTDYIPPDNLDPAGGLKILEEECKFIQYCRDNQPNITEPLWYALASNMVRFEGGRNKFHEFSCKHSGYSITSTDAKFNHALESSGPITCTKIREDGFNCKINCKVKSPAGLGVKKNIDDILLPQNEVEPFPIDALPDCLQSLITQGAKANQCPPDFIAMPVLSTLSIAIGNSAVVEIKPGWVVKANLYACVIGRPGSGKSPAQSIATKPLRNIQRKMAEEYRVKAEEYERSLAVWECDCAFAKKNKNPKPTKPTEPFMNEIYTSDTTVEALAQILERNTRGIALVLDELTAWVNGLNQYKGGKGADREYYLFFWSGITTKINRKNKPPIIVDEPFLTVMGSIPPSVLITLVDEKKRGEDGFIHRIVFSYPDQVVEQRWTEDIIDYNVLTQYHRIFQKLLEMPNEQRVITLDNEAYKLWEDAFNNINSEKNRSDFPDNLYGPWSKLPAQLAKLALIIHCVRAANKEITDEKINAESMTNALSLLNYFQSHTRKVYSQLSESETDKQFRQILEWKKKHNKQEITSREMLSARLCQNTDEVTSILESMQKHGLGKKIEHQGRGKKTIKFAFF